MAKKGGFLLGGVVGGTAAAIAALLFAPKSGKELRDELAAQADDMMYMGSYNTDMAKEKCPQLTGFA
ncbi:YtxH domain-containing protein, partial [Enterococcus faecium]|uniref:YtxH domain-containing protein n=1 Tax=Enterococcus faecium TaxID=1352 RepID=UPI003CC62E32